MSAPRPGSGGRRCPTAVVLAGLALIRTLLGPGGVAASTSSEPPAAACDLPSSSVVAGRPFELSGVTSDPNEIVGILARKDTGESREGTVAVVDGQWNGVIVFGAADGGTWTIDLTVDGKDCVSPLTVTLPAGMVAPPTRPPVAATVEDTLAPGADGTSIRDLAAVGAAGAVLSAWILLAGVALLRLAGRSPFAQPRLRRVVQLATFVGVLGAFVFAELFVYFGVSMSHFDTGVPSDQAALLDVGLWLAVVAGSAIGTIAARRVPVSDPHRR